MGLTRNWCVHQCRQIVLLPVGLWCQKATVLNGRSCPVACRIYTEIEHLFQKCRKQSFSSSKFLCLFRLKVLSLSGTSQIHQSPPVWTFYDSRTPAGAGCLLALVYMTRPSYLCCLHANLEEFLCAWNPSHDGSALSRWKTPLDDYLVCESSSDLMLQYNFEVHEHLSEGIANQSEGRSAVPSTLALIKKDFKSK